MNSPEDSNDLESACEVFHDFWLIRRTGRSFADYWDLLGRKDAPVRLSDDVFGFLMHTLQWVPTLNPTRNGEARPRFGLNRFSPTIISTAGGECFRQICLGWVQILTQGPEPLILRSGQLRSRGENPTVWEPHCFRISRQGLLTDLQQLAHFGEQAAMGEYYLLHLGI